MYRAYLTLTLNSFQGTCVYIHYTGQRTELQSSHILSSFAFSWHSQSQALSEIKHISQDIDLTARHNIDKSR